MLPSPSEPALTAIISRDRFEELVREEIARQFSADDTRRIRRELALMVASISPKEGGLLLGMSPRAFRGLMEKHGVPMMPFGHKTERYRITAIVAKLDQLSIAAKKDLEELRSKLVDITARLIREVEALAA
jgi:hypothetical protein